MGGGCRLGPTRRRAGRTGGSAVFRPGVLSVRDHGTRFARLHGRRGSSRSRPGGARRQQRSQRAGDDRSERGSRRRRRGSRPPRSSVPGGGRSLPGDAQKPRDPVVAVFRRQVRSDGWGRDRSGPGGRAAAWAGRGVHVHDSLARVAHRNAGLPSGARCERSRSRGGGRQQRGDARVRCRRSGHAESGRLLRRSRLRPRTGTRGLSPRTADPASEHRRCRSDRHRSRILRRHSCAGRDVARELDDSLSCGGRSGAGRFHLAGGSRRRRPHRPRRGRPVRQHRGARRGRQLGVSLPRGVEPPRRSGRRRFARAVAGLSCPRRAGDARS